MRREVLRHLLASSAPVSIAEVRDSVGGHENSARGHLDALVEAGLAVRTVAAPTGRGRPRYLYAAAPGAQTAIARDDVVAEEYHGLVRAFATHLTAYASASIEAALNVGRLWGRALATDEAADAEPAPGVASEDRARTDVVDLLCRLGFSPERTDDELVELRTCPLLDLATEHPQVMCNVHAGLVEGAHLARGGDGEHIALEPFAAPGACHLRIPRQAAS